MRKFILLSAVAALAIPSVATAQDHRGDQRSYDSQRYDHRDRDRGDWNRGDRDHGDRGRWRHPNRRHVVYVAPYRHWRYRPVTVGYQLQSVFFGPRYYVNDYNAFGLPYPGRNRQWIRYGNDLLLVNVRTGRVLQVLPNRYYW